MKHLFGPAALMACVLCLPTTSFGVTSDIGLSAVMEDTAAFTMEPGVSNERETSFGLTGSDAITAIQGRGVSTGQVSADLTSGDISMSTKTSALPTTPPFEAKVGGYAIASVFVESLLSATGAGDVTVFVRLMGEMTRTDLDGFSLLSTDVSLSIDGGAGDAASLYGIECRND